MKEKIQIGDKVRRIYSSYNQVEMGKVYVVDSFVSDTLGSIMYLKDLSGKGIMGQYDTKRFEKVFDKLNNKPEWF